MKQREFILRSAARRVVFPIWHKRPFSRRAFRSVSIFIAPHKLSDLTTALTKKQKKTKKNQISKLRLHSSVISYQAIESLRDV